MPDAFSFTSGQFKERDPLLARVVSYCLSAALQEFEDSTDERNERMSKARPRDAAPPLPFGYVEQALLAEDVDCLAQGVARHL